VAKNETLCIQVAKRIYTEFQTQCTAWFDYGKSGSRQVVVVYTKTEPIDASISQPPWEPGSKPPPFLLEMQQQAQEKSENQKKSGTGV
jgi:hypothetical protein